ncbi:MAG: hypothetical protein QNJ00_16530 [Woeseiaceae bacterium]|nr:hypothetical protein [Woeseiaceae bacterium]
MGQMGQVVLSILLAALGVAASWFIGAHFYRKSRLGKIDLFMAERVVGLDIEEAWRRLIAPDRFGYVAWTSPSIPPGVELAPGTEINAGPKNEGGMYVVDMQPPKQIRFGSSPEQWDKSIGFVEKRDGLHVLYMRMLPYTGRGSNAECRRIVENDAERLLYVLGDRD